MELHRGKTQLLGNFSVLDFPCLFKGKTLDTLGHV